MCVTKSQGGNIHGKNHDQRTVLRRQIRRDERGIQDDVPRLANKAGVDEQTALELEIVRQTLIAVEKMKKNGDCIAEGELGDAVTVSICGGSDENT